MEERKRWTLCNYTHTQRKSLYEISPPPKNTENTGNIVWQSIYTILQQMRQDLDSYNNPFFNVWRTVHSHTLVLSPQNKSYSVLKRIRRPSAVIPENIQPKKDPQRWKQTRYRNCIAGFTRYKHLNTQVVSFEGRRIPPRRVLRSLAHKITINKPYSNLCDYIYKCITM